MATLNIRVRVANKVKHFRSSASRVSIGREKSCDLVLPFTWLEPNQLFIEPASNDAVRVKLGSASAVANAAGNPVTTEWQTVRCPAHLAIPTPRGHSIVLEVTVGAADLDLYVLQESAANPTSASLGGGGDVQLEVATMSALGAASGANFESDELTATDWHAPIGMEEAHVTKGQKLALFGTAAVFVVLIVSALGFNRYRHYLADQALAADIKFVNEQIDHARDLLGRRDYLGAKSALEGASEKASEIPSLDHQREQIAAMLGSEEIRQGAAGKVLVDGRWLDRGTADTWKRQREIDDPRISMLEQRAAMAIQSKDYLTARAAYEEAVGIMDRQAVRPHPRYAAVTAALDSVKRDSAAAEMTAKGYVYYQGRWMPKEEQTRLENEAKGLTFYEGEWMTPTQVAEAKKRGGTGKVLFEGKWVTPDEKMAMQGYVKYDGTWMRPEERDALVAKRKAEADKAEADRKEAERKKADAERADKLKPTAYLKSQELLIKKYNLLETRFDAFAASTVRVVFDDGWYIIKGAVTGKKPNAIAFTGKTFYAKIRVTTGDQWEVDTLLLAE